MAGRILVSLMFVWVASFAESNIAPVIIDTPLPPAPPSPFANLDLIPLPVSFIPARSLGIISYTATAVRPGQKFIVSGAGLRPAGDSLFNISMVTLAALNAADYFSTLKALKYHGLEEGNLMMKSVVKDPYVFAAVKIGFTALTCTSLKSLHKKNKPLAWIISVASNLAYSYVVSNNLRIIHQSKAR